MGQLEELVAVDGLNDEIKSRGRISSFHKTTVAVFKEQLERGVAFTGTYFDEQARDFCMDDW